MTASSPSERAAKAAVESEGPLSVVLVEDNEVNRMIARQTLVSLGVDVLEASDGAEAVAMLQDRSVDLVLMDCQMPVMDGYEATAAIRSLEDGRGATLPITFRMVLTPCIRSNPKPICTLMKVF